MSLEFHCRWSSTVAYKEIFKNYSKYWGSFVGGVLRSPYRYYGYINTCVHSSIVFFTGLKVPGHWPECLPFRPVSGD
jgi:hypothetical protein